MEFGNFGGRILSIESDTESLMELFYNVKGGVVRLTPEQSTVLEKTLMERATVIERGQCLYIGADESNKSAETLLGIG